MGQGGRARFDIHFVKQESGKWEIGGFGGPNPVEDQGGNGGRSRRQPGCRCWEVLARKRGPRC
jgi:hypothetical protein